MRADGLGNEDIYDGPLLQGGVLQAEEIVKSVPKRVLYLSRVIEQVYASPGVREVRALRLKGQLAQMTVGDGVNYWVPLVTEGVVPRLDPDPGMLTVRVEGVVVAVDRPRVLQRFAVLRKELIARGMLIPTPPMELPRDRQVGAYQSVQHQFPDNYGINAKGLPADVSTLRKAQAHQLKTWLVFFEQALANYFSKAGHLGRLFQMADGTATDYPRGLLEDVPDLEASWLPLHAQLQTLDDAAAIKALQRLERLLGHLLARFGHEPKHFPQPDAHGDSPRQVLEKHVGRLMAFYRDLPAVTRDRGQGATMLTSNASPLMPGGLKSRIARLLGLRPDEPDLFRYPSVQDALQQVDFFMIEHALLRPMPQDYARDNMLFRFRNGKISKIHRIRNRDHHDVYRLKCFSTGTAAIKKGDQIEIVFTVGNLKLPFTVLEVFDDGFIVPANFDLGLHGNPQGGSWNKTNHEASVLQADPWSLQVSYIFPAQDPRFVDPHHCVRRRRRTSCCMSLGSTRQICNRFAVNTMHGASPTTSTCETASMTPM
jgi:hypothetical protein